MIWADGYPVNTYHGVDRGSEVGPLTEPAQEVAIYDLIGGRSSSKKQDLTLDPRFENA